MSDYAGFAWFYDRYWAPSVPGMFIAAIDRYLLPTLGEAASILDVCCGTGQLAHVLAGRGYRLTGIDGSAEMLRHARVNAPEVELIETDVRQLRLDERFDAAYSTFDSLNHLLTIEDLRLAFANVRRALRPGALFLFDLNMAEAFEIRWSGKMAIDEEEGACFIRFRYDREARLGYCRVTMFRPDPDQVTCWRRSRVELEQRCYSEQEVRDALETAGMELLSVHDATNDLGMVGHAGRAFFLARRAG